MITIEHSILLKLNSFFAIDPPFPDTLLYTLFHIDTADQNHDQAGARISVASVVGEDQEEEEMQDDDIPGYDTIGCGKISSSRPKLDAYETISDFHEQIADQHGQGALVKRFQMNASSKPQLGDYSTIDAVENHSHEFEVKENDTTVGNNMFNDLPVYSTVNKPKGGKRGGGEGDGRENQAGKTADVPDIVTLHSEFSRSLGNHDTRDDFEVSVAARIPTYKKTSIGSHDSGTYPKLNDSVCSISAQQPLYSNCISLDVADANPNVGDLSSREPAPPPIPPHLDTSTAPLDAIANIKVQANGTTESTCVGLLDIPEGVQTFV